jgi:hypothetical protein
MYEIINTRIVPVVERFKAIWRPLAFWTGVFLLFYELIKFLLTRVVYVAT